MLYCNNIGVYILINTNCNFPWVSLNKSIIEICSINEYKTSLTQPLARVSSRLLLRMNDDDHDQRQYHDCKGDKHNNNDCPATGGKFTLDDPFLTLEISPVAQ